MKKKILIICPKFYPKKDGLSGYTTKLSLELSKKYQVDLLTSIEFKETKLDPIVLFPRIDKWSFSNLFSQSKDILKNNYENILIQYVPTMYGPKGGINFSILIYFLYLRVFTKSKISFMFHEIYYPLSFYWKAIILNIVHKIMLTFSLLSSHTAFFSTERFVKEAKWFTWNHNKLIHLPVGDNLYSNKQVRTPIVLSNSRLNITLFGSYHPSKNYSLIFNTFAKAYSCNNKLRLNIIGPTKDELQKDCQLPNNFDEFTSMFPKLEDESVIEVFKQSDFMISYFIDGLTTRRSSIISALAYGLPIISTFSKHTESLFYDDDSIKLLPIEDGTYAAGLLSFLLEETIISTANNKKSAIALYNKYFSWCNTIIKIKNRWS